MHNKLIFALFASFILAGCLDSDNGGSSSDNNYKSCKISAVYGNIFGESLTTDERDTILGQCWNLPGSGEADQDTALNWCEETTNSYLSDNGYSNQLSSHMYQVTRQACSDE